jgi:hypothetical protein
MNIMTETTDDYDAPIDLSRDPAEAFYKEFFAYREKKALRAKKPRAPVVKPEKKPRCKLVKIETLIKIPDKDETFDQTLDFPTFKALDDYLLKLEKEHGLPRGGLWVRINCVFADRWEYGGLFYPGTAPKGVRKRFRQGLRMTENIKFRKIVGSQAARNAWSLLREYEF